MLLNYNNVNVLYGDIINALKGVSLEVTSGSIVSILGANGAGKSTILKSISGLLALENGKITEGDICYNGKSINGIDAHHLARSGISMVIEGRGLFRTLSVEENLKVGTLMRKDGKSEIKKDFNALYEIFPVLKDRRKQIAGTMSGGEQQMLCIGMGLMTKPKLLLLDEPSLGLAPIISEKVFEAIKKINLELDTTILLVEQNAYLSLEISDYVYLITLGNVAAEGKAEEFKGKDISAYYLGGSSEKN